MTREELCALAREAAKRAYCPYSRCTVGAALLTADGRVYTGCNIENAAYGSTICAERVAVFKAVSDGCRDFAALAVAGGRDGRIAGLYPPCGACRQVLREFCPLTMPVLLVTGETTFQTTTLGELLPYSFGPEQVN